MSLTNLNNIDSRQPANNKAGCMGQSPAQLSRPNVARVLSALFLFTVLLLLSFHVFLVDVFAFMTVCVCIELYVLLPFWRNKT